MHRLIALPQQGKVWRMGISTPKAEVGCAPNDDVAPPKPPPKAGVLAAPKPVEGDACVAMPGLKSCTKSLTGHLSFHDRQSNANKTGPTCPNVGVATAAPKGEGAAAAYTPGQKQKILSTEIRAGERNSSTRNTYGLDAEGRRWRNSKSWSRGLTEG